MIPGLKDTTCRLRPGSGLVMLLSTEWMTSSAADIVFLLCFGAAGSDIESVFNGSAHRASFPDSTDHFILL
jgi:tetrahydromethanopterin S-methyltransferase subunit D